MKLVGGVAHILCFLVSITFHTEDLPIQEIQFQPWVEKIRWKREWLPTPAFLLENSMDRAWRTTVHGAYEELDMTEKLTFPTYDGHCVVDYEDSLLPHFISILFTKVNM